MKARNREGERNREESKDIEEHESWNNKSATAANFNSKIKTQQTE
jgi:hypothetical protein